MVRHVSIRLAKWSFVGALILALGSCGGKKGGNFDTMDSGGSKLGKLLGLDQTASGPAQGSQGRTIFCPEIVVLEGTAAAQFHAGDPPSNTNLRVQYSLGDAARECALQGEQIVLKVGIAGKVLLGPVGSPGSFMVPVRIAVIRESDNQPLVSKLYRASATIPAGETQANFTIISDQMSVPFIQDHTEEDYSIKVGIDTAGATDAPAGVKRKR